MNILSQQNLDDLVGIVAVELAVDADTNLYEAVSTIVLHAPPDMGYFDLDYVKNRVAKQIANKVAYNKVQEIIAAEKAKAQPAKPADTQTGVSASEPAQNS